jgi:hypothetical protein
VIYIGIDPGKKGGIALYATPPWNTERYSSTWPMPLNSPGTHVSAHTLSHELRRAIPTRDMTEVLAVIEDVHSMPRDGKVQAFSFGYSLGVVQGVLACLGVKAIAVTPAVWKGYYGLSRDKKASILKANELFPQLHLSSRQDGEAEAALLALYGYRKFAHLKPRKDRNE